MTRSNRRVTKFDKALGEIIHAKRQRIHMSQRELADDLGVTHQQVQKYEAGTDRISVSRLVDIATAISHCPAALLLAAITKEK